MKCKNRKGSAVIVVIITAIVFLIYAASTFSDMTHLKTMHEKYLLNTVKLFNNDYKLKQSYID